MLDMVGIFPATLVFLLIFDALDENLAGVG
jgi:hypothetical protein